MRALLQALSAGAESDGSATLQLDLDVEGLHDVVYGHMREGAGHKVWASNMPSNPSPYRHR